MGSKKAQQKLDNLQRWLVKIAHPVGALQSAKDKLDTTSAKINVQDMNNADFVKGFAVVQKAFAEFDKKWSEWPGIIADCRKEAQDVKKY